MTISPKLEILKALTAKLEEINPSNGFENDLTGAVFRGRIMFGEDDPLPMVSILEPPEEEPWTSTSGNCSATGDWVLVLQGFTHDDFDNPTDPAYVLLEEVQIKLREAKSMDGGFNILGHGQYITGMDIGPGIVRPPDDPSSRAYFWLTVKIRLVN